MCVVRSYMDGVMKNIERMNFCLLVFILRRPHPASHSTKVIIGGTTFRNWLLRRRASTRFLLLFSTASDDVLLCNM